jgi:high-affinity iron transporter
MSNAFVQAATILLREGLEAMLVIAALAGYLNKVGAGHRLAWLYGGALSAILASAIGAWLFAVFNSGEHSDVLEGCIILVAAALMLYVAGSLMVRQDPKRFRELLERQAGKALSQETGWAVATLAFVAVFREGAEAILFINAVATSEGGWSGGLFAGLVAAAVALAVIFYFINLLARKIPLRPLFVLTSVFLLVMAIKFVGEAIQEFQEQNLVAVSDIKGADWMTSLGLNPTWEAVGAQLLVILFAFAAFAVVQRNARETRNLQASPATKS